MFHIYTHTADKNDFPTVILLNARSLFPKIDELCLFVSSVRPGIICITESWLHAGINDDCISLPGYDLYRCDRKARSGGGVCIYLQNVFRCVHVDRFTCPSSMEMFLLRISSLNLLLVCAYVPPNLKASDHREISDFFVEMLDSLLLLAPDCNIMITGDFNNFDS